MTRPSAAARCTGLTATWCPVHGDCRCPPRYRQPWQGTDDFVAVRLDWPDDRDHERTLDDPACPLHAILSTHAAVAVT